MHLLFFFTLASSVSQFKWLSILTYIISGIYLLSTFFAFINIIILLKKHTIEQQKEYDYDMNQFKENINNWEKNFKRKYDEFKSYRSYNRYQPYDNYGTNYVSNEIINAFKIFGLPIESDIHTIKKKYRSLVMVNHPDKYPNDYQKQKIATKNFHLILESYKIIKKYKKN